MKMLVILLAVILTVISIAGELSYSAESADSAFAGVPCSGDVPDAIPQNAFYLPVDQARGLQTALDTHKVVKLDPHQDYSRRGPASVTLKSGQQLYGLLGSKVGRIKVAGGSTGVVIQGVSTDGIEFLPSDKPTRANCIRRISGGIKAKGVKLEDNLFVDLSRAPLDFDTSKDGYLKNNRFIRVMVHGTSPALRMNGDVEHRSMNNVFIWLNVLTPHGDGIDIRNQKDVSFIGLDAESWNWSRRAKNQAMMTVRSTDSLSIVAANGGDPKTRKGRYLDVEVGHLQLLGSRVGPVGSPAITLRPGLRRMAAINVGDLGVNNVTASDIQLNAFSFGREVVDLSPVHTGAGASAEQMAKSIRQLFSPERVGEPWEMTSLPQIPDPAGDTWKVGVDLKSDSTDFIQSLVEKNGVAQLPAGIFYISRSIRLGHEQGIVGAGASRTAIIAKNPHVDLIVAAQHQDMPAPTRFLLADITLQGGRNGVVHDAGGAGSGAQFNLVYLSHVTFRDMSGSGILINDIYAWDNNFVDNVNFYRCADAGIKQRVGRKWMPGNRPGMTYMDKNVFYRCQFVENGYGVDLEANRANNLNAFIGCEFRGNRVNAVKLRHNNSTVFADVKFIGNAGNPVIVSEKPVFLANAYFKADHANVGFLPSDAVCEGCVFERGNSAGSVIHSGVGRITLINSRSIDMPLGTPDTGVVVNSRLHGDDLYNQLVVSLIGGRPSVLVTGESRPVSQLLFGSAFGD